VCLLNARCAKRAATAGAFALGATQLDSFVVPRNGTPRGDKLSRFARSADAWTARGRAKRPGEPARRGRLALPSGQGARLNSSRIGPCPRANPSIPDFFSGENEEELQTQSGLDALLAVTRRAAAAYSTSSRIRSGRNLMPPRRASRIGQLAVRIRCGFSRIRRAIRGPTFIAAQWLLWWQPVTLTSNDLQC
jgi:hypothetical protein